MEGEFTPIPSTSAASQNDHEYAFSQIPENNQIHEPQNSNSFEMSSTHSNIQNAPLVLYAIGVNGDLVPYTFKETGSGSSQTSVMDNLQETAHSFPSSRESTIPPSRRYLNIKLAADIVPSFDGKTPSILAFICACQTANKAVHPGDRPLLKTLIRNKITGNANFYLQNNFEPDSLTSLIEIIKSIFGPKRDLSQLQAQMSNMIQKENESVMQYGIRISESLSSILEAIEKNFPQEAIVGMRLEATQNAVSCFFRGLNEKIEARIQNRRVDSLQAAINIAIAIEAEIECLSNLRSQQTSDSSPRFHPYIKDNTRNKSDYR